MGLGFWELLACSSVLGGCALADCFQQVLRAAARGREGDSARVQLCGLERVAIPFQRGVPSLFSGRGGWSRHALEMAMNFTGQPVTRTWQVGGALLCPASPSGLGLPGRLSMRRDTVTRGLLLKAPWTPADEVLVVLSGRFPAPLLHTKPCSPSQVSPPSSQPCLRLGQSLVMGTLTSAGSEALPGEQGVCRGVDSWHLGITCFTLELEQRSVCLRFHEREGTAGRR